MFPSLTHDGEDERVGEVLVQRQLHHVPAELQEPSGLGQADENVNLVKEENRLIFFFFFFCPENAAGGALAAQRISTT